MSVLLVSKSRWAFGMQGLGFQGSASKHLETTRAGLGFRV